MMEERLQQLRTEYTTYTSRLAIVRQNLLHKLEVNTARGVRLHLILMRSHRIVGNAVPATMARSHEKMIDASLFRHEQFSKLPLIGWSDFITIFHYEILDRLSGKKSKQENFMSIAVKLAPIAFHPLQFVEFGSADDIDEKKNPPIEKMGQLRCGIYIQR